MKEVLLAKADRVKFEPDMKGQSKNGRKSIIDTDYQEAQIIADVMESGMRTLTAWLLVINHREVKEITSACISSIVTCIAKLNPLVKNMKNKKQGSLDRNASACKTRFLWCL